ncbi:unnamed protein product [Dicrocoelium dendriticum]|nr:unnamed protein product [Dicrocoelium dendriticum]
MDNWYSHGRLTWLLVQRRLTKKKSTFRKKDVSSLLNPEQLTLGYTCKPKMCGELIKAGTNQMTDVSVVNIKEQADRNYRKMVGIEALANGKRVRQQNEKSNTVRIFGPNTKQSFIITGADRAKFEKQRSVIYALNVIMKEHEEAQYRACMKAKGIPRNNEESDSQ